MRNVPDKTCTENQYIHFLFNNYLSKTMPFMRCGKIYKSWTGHRLQYGTRTLHSEYLRLQTLKKCNTSCFSTATMVAWMHLSVTLYIYCLFCSIILWWLIWTRVCIYRLQGSVQYKLCHDGWIKYHYMKCKRYQNLCGLANFTIVQIQCTKMSHL